MEDVRGNYRACYHAGIGGRLHVLVWAKENGRLANHDGLLSTARHFGQAHVTDRLIQEGPVSGENVGPRL